MHGRSGQHQQHEKKVGKHFDDGKYKILRMSNLSKQYSAFSHFFHVTRFVYGNGDCMRLCQCKALSHFSLVPTCRSKSACWWRCVGARMKHGLYDMISFATAWKQSQWKNVNEICLRSDNWRHRETGAHKQATRPKTCKWTKAAMSFLLLIRSVEKKIIINNKIKFQRVTTNPH